MVSARSGCGSRDPDARSTAGVGKPTGHSCSNPAATRSRNPPMTRSGSTIRMVAAVLLLGCSAARAQWLPDWTATWPAGKGYVAVSPVQLAVDVDGRLFAHAEATHDGGWYAATARLGATGTFDWHDERLASRPSGMALSGGRVAMAALDPAALVRVVDAGNGAFLHECTWPGTTFAWDERDQVRPLAFAADGSVLLRAEEGGDLVVRRCGADGTVLPAWRWSSGFEFLRSDDIIALPEGGAIVTARGATGDGYVVVRFDAGGNAVLVDAEAGEIGNPIGALHVARDADGALLLAGAPESTFGVPQAQVWKIAPDGSRAWLRVIDRPEVAHPNLDIGGFALAPDGDVVIAVAPPSGPFRVLRLRGGDGSIAWDASAAIGDTPTGLALTPNGRALVGGYAFIVGGGGRITSRMAEFSADGRPCRARTDLAMATRLQVAADAGGWAIFGGGEFTTSGSTGMVQHYDATAPCDGDPPDLVFRNGFDAP
jgi:hypothetical protein